MSRRSPLYPTQVPYNIAWKVIRSSCLQKEQGGDICKQNHVRWVGHGCKGQALCVLMQCIELRDPRTSLRLAVGLVD